ncbi:MAG: invasion associated locus B family protein [Hyphomicrobiales bacterium]|nr:invasion associated locus B family protein [Hyphomicrobiales bacterium]
MKRASWVLDAGNRRAKTAFFAAFLLAAGLGLTSAPPVKAEGVIKATNGDWETRCDTPTGAKGEQCAMIQNVVAEDRPNITLLVIVLKPVDKKKPLLRVVAPPFVFLPTGLGLKVDQVDLGHVPFAHCFGSGCFSEVEMDDKLINQLKTGTTATFIVFQSADDGVGIPVSLNGFAKAFDTLP